MSNRKKRHLSPAGFIFGLLLVIALIFAADAIVRLFWQPQEENIVGTEGFSLTSSSSAADSAESDDDTAEEEESSEESEPDGIVLQLTTADQAEGPLILVDDAHPCTGTAAFSDFSTVTDENVKPRTMTLSIRAEIQQPLCTLFDAYATDNGTANLQIYSTLQSTLDESSIYTNTLPDRSTGYSFDIGLITSTGEVVPYIQKHNEWMLAHVWEYGFILRYPSDKTAKTGISYAPHHFRYVGQPHAMIMYENNFCLEEYLTYLQSYTMESGGLSYVTDTQSYVIYYVPADASSTTTVELSEDTVYTVSGDNQGGFILTITADAATDTDQTEAITEAATEGDLP
ncbi:MAG: D-alanyl-D-alanine carboxypeptidase family protein [Ruminococcus sp.]|nr:D-alanyl-D-alanine carboxypeptidase family protein [Ruminococcus sp.]